MRTNVVITLALTLAASTACIGETSRFWGQAPNGEFWNANAKRFIYAPAFPVDEVGGAARYRYDVFDDRHVVHTFHAQTPRTGMDEVWGELPVEYVTVVCSAEDAAGVRGALLVANATDAKVLLSLSSPGWRAVSSRIVEDGRNNVETDVFASLASYGVALVRFVKQPQSIDR